jgi:hypothetical protein
MDIGHRLTSNLYHVTTLLLWFDFFYISILESTYFFLLTSSFALLLVSVNRLVVMYYLYNFFLSSNLPKCLNHYSRIPTYHLRLLKNPHRIIRCHEGSIITLDIFAITYTTSDVLLHSTNTVAL